MKSQSQTVTVAQLTVILWLAVLAFVAPAAIFGGQVKTLHEAISLVSGTFTGLALAALLHLVFRRVSGLGQPAMFALLSLGVLAMALLQTLADFAGQYLLGAIYADVVPPPVNVRSLLLTYLIYACIYTCNAGLFWILETAQKAREQAFRLAQAQAQAARTELENLRLQLNPHFMCNSLNAISSLIVAGRHHDADRMATKLASFLRSAIQDRSADVPVRDEIEIVEAYLDIEVTRFGDRLAVNIDCTPDARAALVPQFILQPLAENAIKHGVALTGGPARLGIAIWRDGVSLVMAVENDGPARRPAKPDSPGGLGLANTRQRLEIRYGPRATLTAIARPDGFRVEIRLPFDFAGQTQEAL